MKKAWVHNNIKLRAALMRRDDLIRSQAHWYESILDVLPFPVRISDAETNWMFVNAAAERLFGIKRGDMLGKPCDHNKFCICGTDNCSLERAKRGLFQTAFGHSPTRTFRSPRWLRLTLGRMTSRSASPPPARRRRPSTRCG